MKNINYFWIKQNIGEDGITYTPMANLSRQIVTTSPTKPGIGRIFFAKKKEKPETTEMVWEEPCKEFHNENGMQGYCIGYKSDYFCKHVKLVSVQEAVKFIRKQYGKQAEIREM